MFDHVTIRVGDRAASERFYDTVLTSLGIDKTYRTETFSEWDEFSLAGATAANPATRRLHVGFAAPSREQVDEFWALGTEAGYRDDGEPGPRPEYGGDYYGAFLLDPDGNSVEAVEHGDLRREGMIDHLWIRVADLALATRFYEAIAPSSGFRKAAEQPGRVRFAGAAGSMSFRRWDADRARPHRVPNRRRWRCAAVPRGRHRRRLHEPRAAGRASPPRYHPGNYAAYVLDPDGNNIEVVNHHRA